ncbi:MAG: Rrf2 family transcriptional regulator [Defluviitaleaceae bacterium]|nr:Rrf2 family transcriptional regulator [Defluviitaleaceae bacterium]
MLLTKEFDYAIRIIRSLSGFEKRSVRVICDEEYIPVQFAYKILKKLEISGIVIAFRGVNGGYILAKDLNFITMHDVLISVDDNLFISDCMKPDRDCPNNDGGKLCNVHQELDKIQNSLINMLKEKTMDMIL